MDTPTPGRQRLAHLNAEPSGLSDSGSIRESHGSSRVTQSVKPPVQKVQDPDTIAEHIFRHLADAGVTKVFGVPGDFSLEMLDLLERDSSLQWVGCASELGAAYCADGYARAIGLGALVTVFGVGELSAAAGVAGSTAEGVAVLHVVVGPPKNAFDAGLAVHHTFADGNFTRFSTAAAEWHAGIFMATQSDPMQVILDAISFWRNRRQTTYLLIPQDVVTKPADRPWVPVSVTPSQLTVEAVRLITEFHDAHPDALALFGNVAQRRGIRRRMLEFASRGVPLAVLPSAKGLVDETSPQYVGVYNGQASQPGVQDYVEGYPARVLVGCTLADTTTGGFSAHISLESSLSMHADTVEWGDRCVRAPLEAAVGFWLSLAHHPSMDVLDTERHKIAHAPLPERESAFTQNAVWNSIAELLPSGFRLFAEIGSSSFGAQDIQFPPDTLFESASIWNAIGYVFPAAIGASLGDPERRVLAIVGDGALQVTASEFGLLSRYGANPIVIVIANDGYTVERVIRGETASYNDIAAWCWSEVPAVLGAQESVITTKCDSRKAFQAALAAAIDDPTVAHVIVAPLERYDGTPSLNMMGRFMRAAAGLAPLPNASDPV